LDATEDGPKLVALNLLCVPPATGQMSYPNGIPMNPADRPLLHPNLRLLAELVEGAGLDFRVVVLHRSPTDILTSTTVKRNFASFLVQARTLMVNEAVLQAQLMQLDPSFTNCIDYDVLGRGESLLRLRVFLGLNQNDDHTMATRARRLEADNHTKPSTAALTEDRRLLGGSTWKRAEGEAFDAVDATPILSAFDSLHAHFLGSVCSGPEHRRLVAAGCKWQDWNKKLVCPSEEHGKGVAVRHAPAPSSRLDHNRSGGDHLRQVARSREGASSGADTALRHQQPRAHVRSQHARNASASGFDVIIAHYGISLEWLDPLLLRMSRSERTRAFVYLKDDIPDSADKSFAALATRVNLTYTPLFFHRLPNVGREGHSYIHHIQGLYEASPDEFSQPKEHLQQPSLALNPEVDDAFHAAASERVPWDRVLVFLKDSATKEGGFDARHNWQRSLKLLSMAEGARIEGLAGMNGVPPGVLIHHTAMGQSWLKWTIRTEYLPEWRQSNGTLVHAQPKGILRWAQKHLKDPVALRHITTAKRICYKGLFACRAAAVLQFAPLMWRGAYVQLSKGDNVEAGHYMERLWCPLLYRAPETIIAHPQSNFSEYDGTGDQGQQQHERERHGDDDPGSGNNGVMMQPYVGDGFGGDRRFWGGDELPSEGDGLSGGSVAARRPGNEEDNPYPERHPGPVQYYSDYDRAKTFDSSDRPLTPDELAKELGIIVDLGPSGRMPAARGTLDERQTPGDYDNPEPENDARVQPRDPSPVDSMWRKK